MAIFAGHFLLGAALLIIIVYSNVGFLWATFQKFLLFTTPYSIKVNIPIYWLLLLLWLVYGAARIVLIYLLLSLTLRFCHGSHNNVVVGIIVGREDAERRYDFLH